MFCRIAKKLALDHPFWSDWTWGKMKNHTSSDYFYYPLFEGEGFLEGQSSCFDLGTHSHYDPARCGVFADWLQENTERLTAHFSEEDKPLALERLQNLCDWLRSGLQVEG